MNDKLQCHGPWSVWSYATTSLNALSLKKYSSKLAADIDVGLHLLIDANRKSLRDMVSFMSGLIWNSVDVVVESCSSEIDPDNDQRHLNLTIAIHRSLSVLDKAAFGSHCSLWHVFLRVLKYSRGIYNENFGSIHLENFVKGSRLRWSWFGFLYNMLMQNMDIRADEAMFFVGISE